MPEVRYEDTSAHALRLRLYMGSVDHSGLTVFARGQAIRHEVRIDAAVIGSSHWMEVRGGTFAITEMLACQPATAKRALALWRPGEAAIERAVEEVARYRFAAEVVSAEEAEAGLIHLRELIDLAGMLRTEVGLAFEFPTLDSGPFAAETLVWAAATAEGVSARTAHSYPSEGLVVLSRTDMLLAPAARQRPTKELAASVQSLGGFPA